MHEIFEQQIQFSFFFVVVPFKAGRKQIKKSVSGISSPSHVNCKQHLFALWLYIHVGYEEARKSS